MRRVQRRRSTLAKLGGLLAQHQGVKLCDNPIGPRVGFLGKQPRCVQTGKLCLECGTARGNHLRLFTTFRHFTQSRNLRPHRLNATGIDRGICQKLVTPGSKLCAQPLDCEQ
jgi:hypothetical protein